MGFSIVYQETSQNRGLIWEVKQAIKDLMTR